MMRYRGDVSSPQAIDSGAPATFSGYYVDVDGDED